MDSKELAEIRRLEAQVQAMAQKLTELGYNGPLPAVPTAPDLSELQAFLQQVGDSQSKFAVEARKLLAKL